MWIVDALYIIVATALGSALFWDPASLTALCLFGAIAMAALHRHQLLSLPVQAVNGIVSCLLIVWLFLATAVSMDLKEAGSATIIPPNIRFPGLLFVAILAILWIVWGKKIKAGIFISLLPSLFALVLYILLPEREQRLVAVQIGLWSLVSWPYLMTLAKPRQLLPVMLAGPVLLVCATWSVIELLKANPDVAYDIFHQSFFHITQEGPIVAQIVLFAIVVCSLLIHAPFKWLFMMSLGSGVTLGTILMALIFPLGALPAELIILLTIAIVIVAFGCAGVLASAHRARSLPLVALACLALGFMASAVQVLNLFSNPPHPQALVASAAKALAPTLVGIVLASMTAIARFLPVERDDAIRLRTQVILNAWGTARKKMVNAGKITCRNLLRGSRGDVKGLSDPWRLIPLLIFAAAWTAVGKLEEGLWILIPYFLGYMVSSWMRILPPLWLVMFQGMIVIACYGLGIHLTLIPLFCSIGLIAAWPFSRWAALDASYAYPLACLLMAPLWFVYTPSDGTQVVLGVGLVALLANALRIGPMRWILLALTVLFVGVWMSNWIIQRDPFTTIILTQKISLAHQLGLVALHIPLLVLLVITLWISRLRGKHWWLAMSNRDLSAMLLGLSCVGFWIYGMRESILLSVLALAAIISVVPTITRELRTAQIGGFRHPITSTLAIILVLFLVTLSRAIDLLPQDLPPSTQRIKPAGAMGPVYLQVVREGVASLFALLIIIAWQLSCRHGQDIAIMATSTIRRQIPQNPKGKLITLCNKVKFTVVKLGTSLAHLLLWKVGQPVYLLALRLTDMVSKPFRNRQKKRSESIGSEVSQAP